MSDLTTILVKLPREEEVSPESAKTFLSSLVSIEKASKFGKLTGDKSKRLSLEIAVIRTQIHFLITTESDLVSFVETQLQSNYPKVIISKFDDPLASIKTELNVSFLKLTKGTNYPISTYDKFDSIDPLASVLSVLSRSSEEEFSIIQIALESADRQWQNKAINYAEQGRKVEDGSYTPRPDAEVIRSKASLAGFRTTIRLASTNPLRLNEIGRSFGVFARSDGNSFSIETPGKFRARKEMGQLLLREVADSQVLNIAEIATIWHLPGENVKTPSIVTGQKILSEAPANLPVALDQPDSVKEDINFFARTQYRNKDTSFGIKNVDRLRHIWVVGKTGTGKSTMIANMAIDDLRKGRGFTIIDPHGDLCEDLLDYIPSNRINDVIYFNPADKEFPIVLNPLEVTNREEAELVVAGLMSIFTKVWANVWSARMEYILRNSFMTLSELPETTLEDVLKLLSDKSFREKTLSQISDQTLIHFWKNEFEQMPPQLQKEAISPIQNKVGQFVTSPMIRRIIGTPRSSISIRQIMDDKKILLANLSQGRLGEDNSALLGAMLITKFQLAAMNRVDVGRDQRTPHYLYVDEFQNFATNSFVKILSEARKYGLALTLANQYMAQIPENVTKAILGNAGTMVTFTAGADDAAVVHKEFSETFSESDLVNLERFQIAIKLMVDGYATKPFLAYTLALPQGKNQNREKVIRVSRERWSKVVKDRPKVQIEEVGVPKIEDLPTQTDSKPNIGDVYGLPTTNNPFPIKVAKQPDSSPTTEPARFRVVTEEPIDPNMVKFDPGMDTNQNKPGVTTDSPITNDPFAATGSVASPQPTVSSPSIQTDQQSVQIPSQPVSQPISYNQYPPTDEPVKPTASDPFTQVGNQPPTTGNFVTPPTTDNLPPTGSVASPPTTHYPSPSVGPSEPQVSSPFPEVDKPDVKLDETAFEKGLGMYQVASGQSVQNPTTNPQQPNQPVTQTTTQQPQPNTGAVDFKPIAPNPTADNLPPTTGSIASTPTGEVFSSQTYNIAKQEQAFKSSVDELEKNEAARLAQLQTELDKLK